MTLRTGRNFKFYFVIVSAKPIGSFKNHLAAGIAPVEYKRFWIVHRFFFQDSVVRDHFQREARKRGYFAVRISN